MSYHKLGCDCMDCDYLRNGGSAQSELLSAAAEHVREAKGMCSTVNQARLDTALGILKKVVDSEARDKT